MASANVEKRIPVQRQPIQAPSAPPSSAPKIAMPPSQMFQIASCCVGFHHSRSPVK